MPYLTISLFVFLCVSYSTLFIPQISLDILYAPISCFSPYFDVPNQPHLSVVCIRSVVVELLGLRVVSKVIVTRRGGVGRNWVSSYPGYSSPFLLQYTLTTLPPFLTLSFLPSTHYPSSFSLHTSVPPFHTQPFLPSPLPLTLHTGVMLKPLIITFVNC